MRLHVLVNRASRELLTILFEIEDRTFTESGKTGLWSKADSLTYFDEFIIIGEVRRARRITNPLLVRPSSFIGADALVCGRVEF